MRAPSAALLASLCKAAEYDTKLDDESDSDYYGKRAGEVDCSPMSFTLPILLPRFLVRPDSPDSLESPDPPESPHLHH